VLSQIEYAPQQPYFLSRPRWWCRSVSKKEMAPTPYQPATIVRSFSHVS
jgi:hypothetical protein